MVEKEKEIDKGNINMGTNSSKVDVQREKVRAGKEVLALDIDALWKKRLTDHLSESVYYLHLVSSSGGLAAVIILFILALIYYEAFLALIPVWVPLPLLFAVILAGLITKVSLRTLLQEADLLFLITLEREMEKYFRRALNYNFILQIGWLSMVLIALTPIFTHKISNSAEQIFLYFLIPILIKGWNIHSVWAALRLQAQRPQRWHTGARFLFNFMFLYLFFATGKEGSGALIWPLFVILLLAVVLVGLYLLEQGWRRKQALHWLYLLEMENNLRNRFYQFVNAFTDVPKLGTKVRKRAWLSFAVALIPFQAQQSYMYLYIHTFIRANDYFGLHLRLSLVGMLVVYSLPDVYAQASAYFVFLFIASTQLRTLWNHQERQFWLSISPLPKHWQKDSFIWLLSVLLGLQAVLMLLPSVFQAEGLLAPLVLLGLGLSFSYLYPTLFLKRKLGT